MSFPHKCFHLTKGLVLKSLMALARHNTKAIGIAAAVLSTALNKRACAAKESAPSFMPSMTTTENAITTLIPINNTPDLIFGLFIGVMLTASAYLFFIWIAMRDRSQIFLLILLSSLAVNMGSTNESMRQLVGLYNTGMIDILQNYSLIFAYLFSILFTLSFLEVETNASFMRPFLWGAAAAFLLLLAAASLRSDVRFIMPLFGLISTGFILVTGLMALRQQVSGALSHITAFTAFLIGGLALPLHDLGFIQGQETAKTFMYLGYAAAAMMFAIVLASQFASRQEEKEKALEISNERFSLAARGSNEGLFDWNRGTNTLYISDQFRRIVNMPRPLMPRHFKEWLGFIHPQDRLIIMKVLRKLRFAEGTSTISFEYRIKNGAHGIRWLRTKMVGVKARAIPHIDRLVGSIGDITERKHNESALLASEVRFRSITEAHPVPVLIASLTDNTILYASPGATNILGMSHSTLMSHALDRFLVRAAERQEILETVRQEREVNMKEVMLARVDGESMPAALSARFIQYQNQPAMVLGFYDLTERKKAEAQIAMQQEALQQSEKMAALGGLLAGVAHELNNPLSVVMGQTTLLIENQKEEKTKTRAEKIFKAADRCSRIVKSFLSLARRKAPEHKHIDINAIVTASLELLGYQFRNENVALTLDLAKDLPPVIGDGDQLTQVFTNLALNAAQAMHDFGGTHALNIQTILHNAETMIIRVSDTGPGIPPDLRKRVFEPFFTTKGGSGGTGVGLALCLSIIESHGGTMRLEDTPGGGATFVIEMPVAQVAASEKSETDVAQSPPNAMGQKILLVDDEVELAQTLADLLEPAGYTIDLAANGAIALEKLHKTSFDAIISDLRMPVMDGPSLYAALKQSLPCYLNKIIYVTGDTLSPHVNAFLSETPVPVIEKPYRLSDVQKSLSKVLKDNESHSSIGESDSYQAPPSPENHIRS